MALVATDTIDPGPPQAMDGVAPGFGPGQPVSGATAAKTLKQKIITLTFSGTYATGGYTLTPDALGGLTPLFAQSGFAGGYTVVPTYSGGNVVLKLYWRGADNTVLAEVTNGTAIAQVMRLFVMGPDA